MCAFELSSTPRISWDRRNTIKKTRNSTANQISYGRSKRVWLYCTLPVRAHRATGGLGQVTTCGVQCNIKQWHTELAGVQQCCSLACPSHTRVELPRSRARSNAGCSSHTCGEHWRGPRGGLTRYFGMRRHALISHIQDTASSPRLAVVV